ncbi:MAG: tRNA (adenosine(37)-N6)-dimethylallyltransferase MiaA [Pseudoflavonifractor sp.]|nr:tRNA (adenosine(37)-N6)-dimethylallyltransferase MiaA [Pseudoflavonifractor sp.]
MTPTLIVVTGPTGSGKSDLAVALASRIGCDVISADSRQIYKEIPIGTAAPDEEQLRVVCHHFVGTLSLADYYSAARFEADVMELLPRLWRQSSVQVMCGGSMMYVDAVTRGIDELPDITPEVRADVAAMYGRGGIELIRSELRVLDPDYYRTVDLSNAKRLVHAVEICLQSGQPYSSLRTGQVKQRPFRVVKVAYDYQRQALFDRINRRVSAMMERGLLEEARRVYPLRGLNSLNTVGYKELFAAFDGAMTIDEATARIAKNTRVYAKKQLLWLSKDQSVHRIDPSMSLAAACERVLSLLAIRGDLL